MIEASTFSTEIALLVFEFCLLALSDVFPISVRFLCLRLIRRRVTSLWTDSFIHTSSVLYKYIGSGKAITMTRQIFGKYVLVGMFAI